MRESFQWKPLLLSLVFGVLLLWMDFNDVSPISDSVGNLDHVFGNSGWILLELLLPFISIVVFLLFGKYYYGAGKTLNSIQVYRFGSIKITLLLLAYLLLLILIDIDDLLKDLRIPSKLGVPSQSAGYWLLMELIYPVASIAIVIAFGKVCYEYGKSRAKRN